jgi:DNA primase large subunit
MELADFCVKYPFSKKAKELLDSENIQLSEEIVSKGLSRIKNALAGDTSRSSAFHKSDKVEEVASYAAARMILGYMKNRYLTNRFAVAEAKRANHYLSKEDSAIMNEVAAEFGIVSENESDGKLLVPIPTFVKFAPKSIDYKLINRNVHDGKVELIYREKIRLTEEAVKKRVEQIPLVKNASESIKKAAEDLKKDLPKLEPMRTITFKEGDNPPCIEKLLEQVKKHENLNHQARWSLAVYLVGKGMGIEKVVSLYSNLPDFNEKITRYQLEHIKKRGYTVPGCSTMLTYGLCCAECRIGNPLNWKSKEERMNWHKEREKNA